MPRQVCDMRQERWKSDVSSFEVEQKLGEEWDRKREELAQGIQKAGRSNEDIHEKKSG